MALPRTFKDSTEYFNDCLTFLKDYDWIYNYPNTHILVNRTFEKIPPDWLQHLHNLTNDGLNKLALGDIDVRSLNKKKSNIKGENFRSLPQVDSKIFCIKSRA